MMTDKEYNEMLLNKWCSCGSKLPKHALYDGHNIFLTYACDKCERKKLQEFRSDIMEYYECDEPIDGD
jgi:hypothetical protein